MRQTLNTATPAKNEKSARANPPASELTENPGAEFPCNTACARAAKATAIVVSKAIFPGRDTP
jgi:hypothetical protein